MPVFINNVDDYLGPSQACVNPLFAAPPPKKKDTNQTNAHLVRKDDKATVPINTTHSTSTATQKVVQNRRIRQRRKPRIIKCEDDDNKTAATISKQPAIRLDNDNESTAPTNVIDTTTTKHIQQTQTTQTIKKKATVSLSDCLSCSGCVTSAEAVLLDHHSIDKLREIVVANNDSQLKKKERRRKIAFTISSASLADLYRHLYLENDMSSAESSNDMTDESLPATLSSATKELPTRQEFLSNITSFLQSEFNATIVVDGILAQHISLIESASEFCYRFKKTKQSSKEGDSKIELDEEVTSKKKHAIDDSMPSVALSSTKTRYINKQLSNDDSIMKDDDDDDTLMEITTLSHLPGRIIEEDQSEVVSSSSNTAAALPPIQSTSLPMLASSCPGFVCLVEKTAPNVVPLLSSAKSPMTVAGILLKSNTDDASDGDVYHVSIMPCHDKKLEAGRGDFVWERQTLLQVSSMKSKSTPDDGKETEDTVNEVDLVLTTGELLEIVNDVVAKQHTVEGYTPSTSDIRTFLSTNNETRALATAVASSNNTITLNEMNNLELDTGVHGSGSYADYIFRHSAQELFSHTIPSDKPLPWKSSSSTYTATSTAVKTTGVIRRRRRRQETTDLREVTLYEHGDGSYSCDDKSIDDESGCIISSKPVLRFATAYGFKNVQLILQSLSKTTESISSSTRYDYVEVMACPSGCSNGGGQIGTNGNRETPKETKERVRKTVSAVPIIHPNTSNCGKSLAESLCCNCNDQQQGLFNDSILKSKCFDKKSRQLFHTRFHVVPKLELSTGATAGVAVNDTQW